MSDTTNTKVWKPMDTYSEIYVDDEYGTSYTVGVDGDDNLYVLNRATGRAVVIQPDKYRLCRLVDAPPVPATPLDMPVEISDAIGYCWRWALAHAEKHVGDGERYAFMNIEIEKVVMWLDALPSKGRATNE